MPDFIARLYRFERHAIALRIGFIPNANERRFWARMAALDAALNVHTQKALPE